MTLHQRKIIGLMTLLLATLSVLLWTTERFALMGCVAVPGWLSLGWTLFVERLAYARAAVASGHCPDAAAEPLNQ